MRAEDNYSAVVKIFTASNKMDFYRPWQSRGMEMSTGSGAVIEGFKILTNAHVVADHTFVQIKKEGDSKLYTAKIEVIGYDCDLALLTVEDRKFFDDIKPFGFGDLPYLQDTVTVLGYPTGGDKLSLTKGVVSRIEINPYSVSSRRLLTVQIDAAINPGNSGGPVLKDGAIVGVAMQIFQAGQNIGYMIPVSIIQHFLQDWSDQKYDGFPILGIDFSNTENEALRRYYKLDDFDGGALVNNVLPYSAADGVVMPGDVLLEIDGVSISRDGTFAFRPGERLDFTQLVTDNFIGETLKMKMFRKGMIIDVSVPLKFFRKLVPESYSIPQPAYYIYGGMLFTTLTEDLLESWGPNWWMQAPLDFTVYLAGFKRLNPDKVKEVVVLLTVLPDDVNVGYKDYVNQVIKSVNGQTFDSFREFVRLVQAQKKDPFTIIRTEQNVEIILNNKDIDNIDKDILQRNHIPKQFSSDVEQWLKE